MSSEDESITFGEISVRPFVQAHDNRECYWMEHSSGEGMSVDRKLLDALIKKFYDENF